MLYIQHDLKNISIYECFHRATETALKQLLFFRGRNG